MSTRLSGSLGQHQQLGVEEPAGVLHQRQQPGGHIGPDGLESALGVRQPGGQRAAQQQVVAAGDDLPFRSADHPGRGREAGADGQVGVAADQRGDQRQQRGQVGGQVDVHVDQHRGRRGQPRGAQRPAAAGSGEHQHLDAGQLGGHPPGHRDGAVGAGVLRDGDPERIRELGGQVGVQPAQAGLEVGLLVVHGDDDVDDRQFGSHAVPGGGALHQRRHDATMGRRAGGAF
jgi:hypothetical protein